MPHNVSFGQNGSFGSGGCGSPGPGPQSPVSPLSSLGAGPGLVPHSPQSQGPVSPVSSVFSLGPDTPPPAYTPQDTQPPSVNTQVRSRTWNECHNHLSFKTLLRHYAKQALTPRSLNVKLGPRRIYHKGRAAIRHYANRTARPL